MRLYAFFGALILCAGPATPPADTLRNLFGQIDACLAREGAWSATGEITLSFSLRRDGSSIGRPRVSFLRAPPGDAGRQALLDETADALGRCLPARITDALGGAIAGRPLSFRLRLGGAERAI